MSRPFRVRPDKQRYPRALPWAGMFDPVGVDTQNKWEDRDFGDPGKGIQPQWTNPWDLVPAKRRERLERFRIGFCDPYRGWMEDRSDARDRPGFPDFVPINRQLSAVA